MTTRQLRRLRHRLRSLFRRRRQDDEMERELAWHLELLTRERIESGMSDADARRAAKRAFGSAALAREQCRDARQIGLLEDLVKDVRYALRLMRRSPGFAAAAILSLALGIGANTAIFSVVDAVLLRSLPVERPGELVFVQTVGATGRGGTLPSSYLERLRRESRWLSGVAAFASDELRVDIDGTIEQVFGQIVSSSYHEVLSLEPAAGRLLRRDDERLSPPVAVIGYGYWQRRFGGAPAAIGKAVTFDGRTYTIVGVAPAGFWGLQPGRHVELTLPIGQSGGRASADAVPLYSVARLRPDVSASQATAEADTIFRTYLNERGTDGNRGGAAPLGTRRVEVVSASRGMDGLRTRFARPLYALSFVAGLVLVIACVNLGSLVLVRGTARARELAIRLATGASAARLLRQLLTETLLLFLFGAAAGQVIAYLAIQGLTHFFAIGRNPILLDVRYDVSLAVGAGIVALAAGLITGLWPAVRALRTSPQAEMKDGEARLVGSRRAGTTGRWIVGGQITLSVLLLVQAVMFGRTMMNLRQVDLGFRAAGVVTMSLDPVVRTPPGTDPDPRLNPPLNNQAREAVWRRVLERVRTMPGIQAASLSVLTPLSGRNTGTVVSSPELRRLSDTERTVRLNHVSEDYFRTFRIEILAGRAFTPQDGGRALRVAMVNEAAAQAYFAGQNPIGRTLGLGEARGAYQIVGVVADHKHVSVREPAPRFVFVPVWQPVERLSRITLAVHADAPTADVAPTVAQTVHAVHTDTLVSDVIGVDEQIDATLVSERLLSTLAAVFAALALGLAAIGLYGILSYSVAGRRSELGLRIALGAPPARVVWSVLRDVLVQVTVGIIAGLSIARAMARVAEGLLFGVAPIDPWNYVISAGVLAAIAGVAAWLPARRACAIDPCETLRGA